MTRACLVAKVGDVAHHVAQRVATQDGYAVVGLLAEGDGFVARLFQRVVRKLVVGELELLQAQGIDRVGGQPGQHLGQAHRQEFTFQVAICMVFGR